MEVQQSSGTGTGSTSRFAALDIGSRKILLCPEYVSASFMYVCLSQKPKKRQGDRMSQMFL